MAVAGGLYLFLAGSRLLNATERDDHEGDPSPVDPLHIASAQVGDASLFTEKRPLHPAKAAKAFAVCVGAIALAALNVAPIASTALSGAGLLILLGLISADEAYRGLKQAILILHAGMGGCGLEQGRGGW